MCYYASEIHLLYILDINEMVPYFAFILRNEKFICPVFSISFFFGRVMNGF